MKAGTTETKKPVLYLQAYQAMAGEAIASSGRQQNIILIGLLLTAPLALPLHPMRRMLGTSARAEAWRRGTT